MYRAKRRRPARARVATKLHHAPAELDHSARTNRPSAQSSSPSSSRRRPTLRLRLIEASVEAPDDNLHRGPSRLPSIWVSILQSRRPCMFVPSLGIIVATAQATSGIGLHAGKRPGRLAGLSEASGLLRSVERPPTVCRCTHDSAVNRHCSPSMPMAQAAGRMHIERRHSCEDSLRSIAADPCDKVIVPVRRDMATTAPQRPRVTDLSRVRNRRRGRMVRVQPGRGTFQTPQLSRSLPAPRSRKRCSRARQHALHRHQGRHRSLGVLQVPT